MKHQITKFSLIFFIIISTIGCSKVEKVYQWKRTNDEIFNLRFKLSNNNKKLMLLNQYIKSGSKQTYISDYFSDCQYYNEANFNCEGVPGSEKFVMRDGKIIWYYWTEERHYEFSLADTFAYTFLLD